MQVKVEEIDKTKVKLEIEVPLKDVEKGIEKAYSEVSKKINIPGFRKGKVPKQVIDQRLSRDYVRHEALEPLVSDSYEKAIKENKVKTIDKPEVDIVSFEEGQPLKFTAEVEVKPKVDPGDYTNINIEMDAITVTDEEVGTQLEYLAQRFGKLEVVEERPVIDKDFVLISFQGFLDGEKLEKASANDYLLELGKGMFLPDFEKNLLGARKGEIREFKIKFPENYGDAGMSGKEVQFKVIIKEIKSKKLPELNDDFAKEAGAYENLKELKEDIEKKVLEMKERDSKIEFERLVIEKLVSGVEVEIPQKLVERELNGLLVDFLLSLSSQNIDFEDYLKTTKKTADDIKGEMMPEAEKRVKNTLVLEEIAEREGLEVTPEEVENQLAGIAFQTRKTKEEVKKLLTERGDLGLVEYDLKLKKSINFVVEKANRKEKGNKDKKDKKGQKDQKDEKDEKEMKPAAEAGKSAPAEKPEESKGDDKE